MADKNFARGDVVTVTYQQESYHGEIVGRAIVPPGAWRVLRKAKRQRNSRGGALEWVEVVDPRFIVKGRQEL